MGWEAELAGWLVMMMVQLLESYVAMYTTPTSHPHSCYDGDAATAPTSADGCKNRYCLGLCSGRMLAASTVAGGGWSRIGLV